MALKKHLCSGSIDVHLYAQHPTNSSRRVMLGSTVANQESEAAVKEQCETTHDNHRFTFTIPRNRLASLSPTWTIDAYGISLDSSVARNRRFGRRPVPMARYSLSEFDGQPTVNVRPNVRIDMNTGAVTDINVNGHLVCGTGTATATATRISVRNGGRLECGTAAFPHQGDFTLTLNTGGDITVETGGRLVMHGDRKATLLVFAFSCF